jgi:3-methylfumaryl-CoA hydratase
MTANPNEWSDWVGRSQSETDVIASAPLNGLKALLDRGRQIGSGEDVRPCAHWLYFLPFTRQSEMGEDGHPRRGGFLPPIDLPRRMWAGSRIEFPGVLRVGEVATRTSTIVSIAPKAGRSGRMVFVTVRHEVAGPRGVAIREDQDIVYRDAAPTGGGAGGTKPAAVGETFSAQARRTISPTELMLFRFSALTFNGHRIHYDQPYATGVEGYPGLVVHGPLIATLLLDLLLEECPATRVRAFRFRAVAPLFAPDPFEVARAPIAGGKVELRAVSPSGATAMAAEADIADQ